MAQLTVRGIDDELVRLLKQKAAEKGRSAEAEHREILRHALIGQPGQGSFAERAARLRERLNTGLDSTELIRADRMRDSV